MFRTPILALAFAAALPAAAAMSSQPDASRLASQYATWAGGKSNADALVSGLSQGSSVMIVTTGAGNTRNLAGFTPQTRMSNAEIAAALAAARSTLASMGIRQPTADQIQAALIGGEITLGDGRTRLVQGEVALSQPPVPAPLASR